MRKPSTPSIVPEYADDAYTVLVHIPLDDDSYQRDAYVVGCSTREEAETTIRELYPTEARLKLIATHLSATETKGLKLMAGQFRPLQ